MSNQKCVKFLLGFVLFLVVSLCSFTLSYADVTHGTVTLTNGNDSISYNLPYIGYMYAPSSDSLGKVLRFSYGEPTTDGQVYFYYKVVSNNAPLSRIIISDNGTEKNTNTASNPTYGIEYIGDYWYRVNPYFSSGVIGQVIYLTNRVSLSGAFISNQKLDSIDAILEEIQSFHNDVNSSLDDIYSIMPFSNKDNLDFVVVPYDIAVRDINISYDEYLELYNVFSTYFIGSDIAMWNSSGYLRDVPIYGFLLIDNGDGTSSLTARYPFSSTAAVLANGLFVVQRMIRSVPVYYRFVLDNSSVPVSGLNDSIDNLNNQAQQNEALESQFTGSMTANFNALNLSQFDFGSDTLSGMAVVGGIMTSIFNSLGKWSVIYTFPLMLGVVLVLLGRISRSDRSQRHSVHESGSKGGKKG